MISQNTVKTANFMNCGHKYKVKLSYFTTIVQVPDVLNCKSMAKASTFNIIKIKPQSKYKKNYLGTQTDSQVNLCLFFVC